LSAAARTTVFGLAVALALAAEARAQDPASPPPVEDLPIDGDADDTQPLWEIGVVGAGGYLPDYPAADENSPQAIALPYAVYRGDFFRLGDRGVARGIFADTSRFELDVGIDAAFRVDSDDNDAREGMADLDYLLEVGPRLTWYLLPRHQQNSLYLSFAGRAVFSTDFANVRYEGITLAPRLTYWRNNIGGSDFNATIWVEPLFGFDGLNDYFYEVEAEDVRPGRPAFEADDGYIGTELSLGLSYGFSERLRAFGGVQLGYWGNSANDDSPLHRDDFTIGVGGGLRWTIFASETQVER
jgi:hypothetical protein